MFNLGHWSIWRIEHDQVMVVDPFEKNVVVIIAYLIERICLTGILSPSTNVEISCFSTNTRSSRQKEFSDWTKRSLRRKQLNLGRVKIPLNRLIPAVFHICIWTHPPKWDAAECVYAESRKDTN